MMALEDRITAHVRARPECASRARRVAMNRRHLRYAVAGLAAGAAAAAPAILSWLGRHSSGWGDTRGWLFVIAPPLLGSIVFTLIPRDRPRWTDGICFASAIGLPLGLLSHYLIATESSGEDIFGWLVVPGVWVTCAVVGIGGASLAMLLSRYLLRERSGSKRAIVKPWHLGAAVAIIDVAAVTALMIMAS
jgi:peptidoglycan/LPS O-acetylase OafA/YrhL